MIKAIIFVLLIIVFGIMIFKIIDLQEKLDVEKEIRETLETKLKLSYIQTSQIVTIERPNILDLESKFQIHFEDVDRINETKIKNILANEFIKEIENNMEIISEDDYMRRLKTFRARIRIVEVKK